MRKALLTAMLGLGLVTGLALAAYAEEAPAGAAATGQQHIRKGEEGGEGGAAPKAEGAREGGHEGGMRPVPVTVDLAKYPDLAKAVEALNKAIADAQAQAIKDLGDKDGKLFIGQTLRKTVSGMMGPRPSADKEGGEGAKAPDAPKAGGDKEGGEKPAPKAQPKGGEEG